MLALTHVFLVLAAEGQNPGIVDIEVSLVLWTWVTFVVLLLVLKKYAWGPILQKLDERADQIEKDLETARKLKAEAEALHAEYRERLEKVQKEIEEMREEAAAQGEELRRSLQRQGEEEVQELRERAQKEIELAMKKVRADLRRETIELALQVAEQVAERAFGEADHRRFAEEALAALEKKEG